ncbi:hypothetical protein [Ktedonobacter racemifer]|nr:hypothetical protein [Ktedonobacter racemifer]
MMFKPLRFDPILKAIPGLAHLRLTPHAAHNAKKHARVHVDEQVEIDQVQATPKGLKETRIRENIQKDVKVERRRGETTTEVHERITEDIKVKRVESDGVPSETLMHVHTTIEDVTHIEMTPPHPPREETPIYQRTHHHLVHVLDTPCAICGVRNSTLQDPKENPFGAQDIETHHYPIERSLLNACDPKKVHHIFPQVKDYESLEDFVDSEANMMVLCDVHHRHPHYGIHHILAQDFFVQPFLYGGYEVVAEVDEVEKVMVANERVIKRHAPKDLDN